jgi:hypothetical protein
MIESIVNGCRRGMEYLLLSVFQKRKQETLSGSCREEKNGKKLEHRVLEIFLTKVCHDPLKRKLAYLLFSGLKRRGELTFQAVYDSLNVVNFSSLPLTESEKAELMKLLDKNGIKTVSAALDEMSVELVKAVLKSKEE